MSEQIIDPAATPPANPATPPAATPPAATPPATPATPPAAAKPPAEWEVTLDKDFADILKPQVEKLKEYGLAPEQAQKIVNDATKEMKDNLAAIAADDKEFEKKHGGAQKAQAVKDIALQVMQKVNITPEDATALTKIFGGNKVYDVFYELSKSMGADTFKNFEGSGVVYQPGNMTPEQAAAEATRLQSDPDFMAKIANDDKDAISRLENLFNIQHGVRK